MRKENVKSLIFGVPFLILLFGGTYLWRKYKDEDILNNSKYAIGHIVKKTGSLTSGEQWHYEFKFKGFLYKGYRSTHVDYNVELGNYFLVNFSGKNPNHSKIIYDRKLNADKLNYIDSVWDSIPQSILHNALKK